MAVVSPEVIKTFADRRQSGRLQGATEFANSSKSTARAWSRR